MNLVPNRISCHLSYWIRLVIDKLGHAWSLISIAAKDRAGIEPAILKNFSFYRLYQLSPTYPEAFFLCGEGWTNTIAERWTWTINSGVWSQQATFALSRSGCGGAWTHDLSVKSRLLCQLSYTPIMDHDGVEPPTPRASIWRSTVELTIHKPVTRFGLALLVWKTRILPLDDTSKYSSNTTIWDRAATD